MKAKANANLEKIIKILSLVAVSVVMVFLSLLTMYFLFNRTTIPTKPESHELSIIESLGLSGDFIGGIIGTVIAALTVYLLWQTFDLQRKELKASRKELKLTRAHLAKQQFEATFFSLLDTIRRTANNIKFTNENMIKYEGNNLFEYIRAEIIGAHHNNWGTNGVHRLGTFKLENFLADKIHELEPNNAKFIFTTSTSNDNPVVSKEVIFEWANSNGEKYCGLLYLFVYKNTKSILSSFFRLVNSAMRFAIEERMEFKDEARYLNMLQAQLSSQQLAVMFYNYVSPASLNSEGKPQAKEWADNYQFFQHIEVDYIIDKEHCKFYPKTHFKCLGNKIPDEYSWET